MGRGITTISTTVHRKRSTRSVKTKDEKKYLSAKTHTLSYGTHPYSCHFLSIFFLFLSIYYKVDLHNSWFIFGKNRSEYYRCV